MFMRMMGGDVLAQNFTGVFCGDNCSNMWETRIRYFVIFGLIQYMYSIVLETSGKKFQMLSFVPLIIKIFYMKKFSEVLKISSMKIKHLEGQ